MAIIGKIKQMFSDKERTIPVFPRTVTSAITDADGTVLDDILNENILYLGEESEESSAEVVNADSVGGYTPETLMNSFINKIYPVGSTYITNANESPASYLGGTWTLTGKGFISDYGTKNEYFVSNGNVELSSCYVVREGTTCRVKLSMTNLVEITDTAVELGTLDIQSLGFNTLLGSQYVIGCSDNGNIIWFGSLHYSSGVISCYDIVGADSIATDTSFYCEIILQGHRTIMLNSACDKFYWQRTA